MKNNNKIKPILFSTPMVQAILEGRKTQTRRIVKFKTAGANHTANYERAMISDRGDVFRFFQEEDWLGWFDEKPKYNTGDILWVRESVKVGAWNYEEKLVAFDYKASPELKKTPWVEFENHDDFDKIHEQTISELSKLGVEPRIDDETEMFQYEWAPGQSPLKWKPSIHMPKAAARIFLEVTNVRVERLQDISNDDVIAEGIKVIDKDEAYLDYQGYPVPFAEPRGSFFSLWTTINGQSSTDANPWFWVYEFKRIGKPANF